MLGTSPRRPARARWVTALTALLVLAAACSEQSRVDRNATIRVSGAVLAPDGSPAANRPVKLGTGVEESDGAFAVLTVGLSCAAGACTGKVRNAQTDAAGEYVFTLKGRDTQSSFGEAVSVLVSATGAPRAAEVSGPMSSARFRVQTETLSLPTLTLVDPGLAIDGDSAAGLLARWAAARSGPFELTYDDGDEVPVWLVTTADTTATIDPRVLEDTAGRVVVAGRYEEAIEGGTAEMRWRSPGVAYAAGAGAPPSRGRACRYVDGAGASVDPPGGCGLTDGDLADSELATPVCQEPDGTGDCAPSTAAIIDLGTDVPAELVVVRGCEGGCAVDVSTDGTTFTPAGSAADGYGVVALGGAPVRAVRVGVGGGIGLREVSVWGPAPERALLPLDEGGRNELAGPYRGGTGDDGPSTLLIVIAVVLAAAALVGVGVALGRRRSAPTG